MLEAEDFKKLAKQTKNAQLKVRYLALYHFKLGQSRTKIAFLLGVARGSVNTWVSSYLANGLEGLNDKPRPGRSLKLSAQQLIKLRQFIETNAIKGDGGRLIAEDVKQYIAEQFNVQYHLRGVYRLMHAQGFSWITSRSRHPKQSTEKQEAFKKLPTGNDPSHPRPPTS
jgi:transposase